MIRLLLSFLVSLCLLVVTVAPVAAGGEKPPIQPKLLDPKVDRLFMTGPPPEETRVWKERVFTDDQSTHITLCAEDLIIQPIFLESGPAVGEGGFCLWDHVQTGANEYFASTTSLSGSLQRGKMRHLFQFRKKGKERQLLEFKNCPILAEDEKENTTTAIPRQHILTCPAENGSPGCLGQFNTRALSAGEQIDNSGIVSTTPTTLKSGSGCLLAGEYCLDPICNP